MHSAAVTEQLPECSRREDPHAPAMACLDQLLVAADQEVRRTGKRRGNDPAIGRIAFGPVGRMLRRNHLRVFRNECDDFVNPVGRHSQLFKQHALKLAENRRADQKLMLGKHDPEHVVAHTARNERGDQDIGVKQNFQGPGPRFRTPGAGPGKMLSKSPSGDIFEDIFVREPASSLGERRQAPANVFETRDRELPPQRFPREFALASARPFHEPA